MDVNTCVPCKGIYKVVKHNSNVSILIEKAPTDIKNVNVWRVTPNYYKTETPTTQSEAEWQ